MKTFKRWMAICLVSIATAGLVVACGDDDENCIDDGDCGTGSICDFATETCAVDCTNDQSVCEPGEEACQPRGGDNPGSICVYVGGGTPSDPTDPGDPTGGCGDDDSLCPGDNVCINDACVPPAGETYYVGLIEDTSSQCKASDSDPGSDLYGIRLQKADGQTFYADVIDANRGLADNDDNSDPDSIINGEAPGFDDICEEGFTGNVYVMGCGGELAFNFYDPASGDLVEIEAGDYIYPMEAQCGNDTSDEWTVHLCDASVGDGNGLIGNLSKCNGKVLGSGKGESGVEVTF